MIVQIGFGISHKINENAIDKIF